MVKKSYVLFFLFLSSSRFAFSLGSIESQTALNSTDPRFKVLGYSSTASFHPGPWVSTLGLTNSFSKTVIDQGLVAERIEVSYPHFSFDFSGHSYRLGVSHGFTSNLNGFLTGSKTHYTSKASSFKGESRKQGVNLGLAYKANEDLMFSFGITIEEYRSSNAPSDDFKTKNSVGIFGAKWSLSEETQLTFSLSTYSHDEDSVIDVEENSETNSATLSTDSASPRTLALGLGQKLSTDWSLLLGLTHVQAAKLGEDLYNHHSNHLSLGSEWALSASSTLLFGLETSRSTVEKFLSLNLGGEYQFSELLSSGLWVKAGGGDEKSFSDYGYPNRSKIRSLGANLSFVF